MFSFFSLYFIIDMITNVPIQQPPPLPTSTQTSPSPPPRHHITIVYVYGLLGISHSFSTVQMFPLRIQQYFKLKNLITLGITSQP